MPFPPAKIVAAAIKRWAVLCVATVATATAVSITPGSYTEITERRSLHERGRKVVGTIISHRVFTGRNECSSSAEVRYVVNQRPFVVSARGCGALPSLVPLGRPVDVTYLAETPETSEVYLPGAQVPRMSWFWLSVVWGTAAFLSIASYLLWAGRSPFRRHKNALYPSIEGMPKRLRLLVTPHVKR